LGIQSVPGSGLVPGECHPIQCQLAGHSFRREIVFGKLIQMTEGLQEVQVRTGTRIPHLISRVLNLCHRQLSRVGNLYKRSQRPHRLNYGNRKSHNVTEIICQRLAPYETRAIILELRTTLCIITNTVTFTNNRQTLIEG
jgi:hypothetical protein